MTPLPPDAFPVTRIRGRITHRVAAIACRYLKRKTVSVIHLLFRFFLDISIRRSAFNEQLGDKMKFVLALM